MSNQIKIVKDEHRVVEKLFEDYKKLEDKALKKKKALVEEICSTLTHHIEMEETLLYPKLEERFTKKGDEGGVFVKESYAEHEIVKDLIADILNLEPDDVHFDAKVTVLEEVISHHVREEEKEMLPKTEKQFSKAELDEIGSEMATFQAKHAH